MLENTLFFIKISKKTDGDLST